ncbi:MAG: XRE family transcriptional regulator [Methylovirgula sp.]|uniref:helix-turn-helix domain-containing protein n=1 Tax=Methylovirgula sp. TaxID=1978224 RepID=UPI0030761E71
MDRKTKNAVAVADDSATTAQNLLTVSNAPPGEARSLERAIGSQIRQLRRRLNLSVADLASAAQISTGMMSKIETGQISASLASLQSIAAALSAPMTSLFAAFEEQRDCSFVKADQGVVIERRGSKVGHIYQLLGHALGGDIAVEPYLITLEKEAAPYTAFQHAGREFIYMLTGVVDYRHGDKVYRLAPGDSLLFDSSAMHGPENLIELPMTYLSIIIYQRDRT